ncbi:MAG: leishmanolysin-related zinc metalloendopeptidase [Gemmatimonadota bacterium]
MSLSRIRLAPLIPLALALACGGGPSEPPTATGIVVLSGGNQSGPVGGTLPQPIVIQVTSSKGGGLASTLVSFTVTSGGGSVNRSTAITDATGATSVAWSLGATVGNQQLAVSAGTGISATVSAVGMVGAPALLFPQAGNSQFAVVGTPVAIRPKVMVADAFNNPIPGVTVTFAVAQGGGMVTGGTQVTDAAGTATLGSWTLGPGAGSNILSVAAGALVTQFLGTGIPAVVAAAQGNDQIVNAGTQTPIRPSVAALDGQGNPLAGVQVAFQVASGGGAVLGSANVTTNAAGIAQVGGWVLGVIAGPNVLNAVVPGVPTVAFSAQGVPAVATSMVATSPIALSGFLGNFLAALPEVRLTDAVGNPVGGQSVTFTVTGGGGQLAGAAGLTNYDGRVAVGAWRLGGAAATQTLQAATAGVPAISFTSSAGPLPPPEFEIEVRFRTTPTAAQAAAFTMAADRWKQIILGDVEDVQVTFPASSSGCFPALNEIIDDLVIYVDLVEIDGPLGVLGSAGFCLFRNPGFLPVVGRMRFDVADLALLETTGRLEPVILHEMGHVLGMGILWGPSYFNMVPDHGGFDPHFTGPTALGAFAMSALPGVWPGKAVPVENTGGSGTAYGHWRETTFDSELMTGYSEGAFIPQPLSAVTIGALRDFGYVVNDAVADPYTLPAFLLRLGTAAKYQLNEVPLEGPFYGINRQGRIERVVFR